MCRNCYFIGHGRRGSGCTSDVGNKLSKKPIFPTYYSGLEQKPKAVSQFIHLQAISIRLFFMRKRSRQYAEYNGVDDIQLMEVFLN